MNVFVTGIDTGVGKTIVSAILAKKYSMKYWKLVQCGEDSDRKFVEDLTNCETYKDGAFLRLPLSPWEAMIKDNQFEDILNIRPPQVSNLIVEGAGGAMVPISAEHTFIDYIKKWEMNVVLVCKEYLGSFNHTLLTLKVFKDEKIPLMGIIFNGESRPEKEKYILDFANTSCLGRIPQFDKFEMNKVEDKIWIN